MHPSVLGPVRACNLFVTDERESVDGLRGKSKVIGGWLPSLTMSAKPERTSR